MVENYNEVLKMNSELNTDCLLLRKFRIEDAQDVLEYASDERTVRYLTWEGMTSLEQAKDFINNIYNSDCMYAIELKETGHCIGAININLIPEHEKASFGYVLNKKYWGCGYMTEALSAILSLAFEKLKLNRVEAIHYSGNEGSGRVMEKCGMIKEGFALQEMKIKGIFRDVVHYGILKDQWGSVERTYHENRTGNV